MAETENAAPAQDGPAGEIEQARFSALFSAVDVAKAVAVPGASIADRMAEVLAAADQAYAWLTAEPATGVASFVHDGPCEAVEHPPGFEPAASAATA